MRHPSVSQKRATFYSNGSIGVLAIAQAYGYTTLVLGAWGCGAFANDPHRASLVTGRCEACQKSTGAWKPHPGSGREERRYG